MLKIPPDFTFVVQVVSFFILWLGLKAIIWDPMLKLLEQREARTSGAKHAAEESKAAAVVTAAEYDSKMKEVRSALAAEAQAARDATEKAEHSVLAGARDAAAQQLGQLRDNLGRQAAASRDSISTEARGLASRMVERVAGRAL